MFILTTLIDKYVKKLKSPLYVCFVDFKKAYDSVWRQALLYKLLRLNIDGLFFNILKSMYGHNETCVRVSNSRRSHFFTSNVGVRMQRMQSAQSCLTYTYQIFKAILVLMLMLLCYIHLL